MSFWIVFVFSIVPLFDVPVSCDEATKSFCLFLAIHVAFMELNLSEENDRVLIAIIKSLSCSKLHLEPFEGVSLLPGWPLSSNITNYH